MSEKKYRLIIFIASLILSIGVGFLIGRSTIKDGETITTIKYIKGEKITDSIPYPVPYNVIKPVDTADVIRKCVKDGIYTELFPEKTNTEYIVITKEDTSAIILDWATKRQYHEVLFDSDTIGKCEIDADVQYNRINLIGYTYIPIQKEVGKVTNKVKFFSPFVGAGLLFTPCKEEKDWILNTNVGFFVKEKYGINIQYNRSLIYNINYFGGSFIYKF